LDTLYLSYPVSWILTFTAHFACWLFVTHKMWGKKKEIV